MINLSLATTALLIIYLILFGYLIWTRIRHEKPESIFGNVRIVLLSALWPLGLVVMPLLFIAEETQDRLGVCRKENRS